ncbi:uncharacterized protein EAE97_002340 [Botrytis byssoidea]|uniref:Homeobox domain-containing protein n=1 Tax=Botrytis byssoidea TaxID=139641 RepID=A0A9P5ITN6_9HELO|nr:uncharacterized protein EAE97_002340 [Botrytis byssoidea]KAF7950788.1 hypothetical protein EAE97_002340 [Botrytis byssoidea]
MDYVQPTFQHFSQHPSHDQLISQMTSGGIYNDHQYGYSIPQHQPNMMNMATGQKTNETKPRLGKDEVDILEFEFNKNPKPTTQTKRGYADTMGVELSRINNWFQNRRAKRKQEKKTEAYEAGQAREALGYSVSAPSSPDFPQSNYNIDYPMVPQQSSSMSFPTSGPPPATAPYNPQYADPTNASMQSLQRAMASAQPVNQNGEFSGNFNVHHNDPLQLANMLGMGETSDLDRAPFPTANAFDYDGSFNFQPAFNQNIFDEPEQLEPFGTGESGHTPTAFNTFSDDSTTRSLSTVSASSQPFTGAVTYRPAKIPSVDDTSDETSLQFSSPPPSSRSFKSPRPPTDIVARRKKVQVKPAALGTDTMRSRPPMGPRTVSNVDGFRRQVASPLPSPMRRIVSAGGNVLTGRIQKPGIESAQRSPINIHGFENASSFMEQNYHMINQPSLTAGSSLTSSLAPPTPMSPRERQMTLKRENSSSHEDDLNFMFDLSSSHDGLPTLIDPNQITDQTPPETPQASLVLQQTNTSGWPNNIEHNNTEQHWNYDIPDEPLYTPSHDHFAAELSMPQPSYASQPVTPAFGSFNQGGPLLGNGHDSPQFNNNASPLYTLSNGGSAEYSFPHDALAQFSNIGLVGSSPTMTTKQKQYQFSNVTPADYSEK